MNNKEKVYKILSEVLDLELDMINENTSPDNTISWDSFNALMLISEFEEQFKLCFTMKEVEHVNSVKEIINVLKSKGVVFS